MAAKASPLYRFFGISLPNTTWAKKERYRRKRLALSEAFVVKSHGQRQCSKPLIVREIHAPCPYSWVDHSLLLTMRFQCCDGSGRQIEAVERGYFNVIVDLISQYTFRQFRHKLQVTYWTKLVKKWTRGLTFSIMGVPHQASAKYPICKDMLQM